MRAVLHAVQPGTLEDLINLFITQSSNLGDHKKHVYEAHRAPTRKELKRSPIVRGFETTRIRMLYDVDEQPVEFLAEGAAKRSDAIGPEPRR